MVNDFKGDGIVTGSRFESLALMANPSYGERLKGTS